MTEYIMKEDVIELFSLPPDLMKEYILEMKGVWFDDENPADINSNELASKIAGHSYYHGDRILAAIYCMAEGKEVGNVKPTNVYDKDLDLGATKFGECFNLQEEYCKWIEQRNKEIQEFTNDTVDPSSIITAIVFLESKGFRRVFYD